MQVSNNYFGKLKFNNFFSSDICYGLDYLDSGLCGADLLEGTLGGSEKKAEHSKDVNLLNPCIFWCGKEQKKFYSTWLIYYMF